MSMNHKRLVNALIKAGANITWDTSPSRRGATRFRATKGAEVLVWYSQPNWKDAAVMDAVSVHNPDPATDIMTDLFLDVHHHTIRSAVASLG